MSNDSTNKLIAELASWNGRLSVDITVALINLRHNHPEAAIKVLQEAAAEYEAYRDDQLAECSEWHNRLMRSGNAPRYEIDYDEKHGE